MEVQSRTGRVSLNYAGHRYAASYVMSEGVLTVRSPYGCAEVAFPDPDLATASAARTLLRQLIVRNDARNGGRRQR